MGRAVCINDKLIVINKTNLSFNKVWVVSTSGNDITGDGSLSSPFASVSKAINTAASGDAIYIFDGDYRLTPMYVNSYHSAGIFPDWKAITVVGESGPGTRLTYYGADSPQRDGPALHGTGSASNWMNFTYIYYPGKTSNYSNSIFSSCQGNFYNIFFWIRGNKYASYSYYNSQPSNQPRIYNCAFYHDLGSVLEDYSGRPLYENCLWNVAPQNSSDVLVTCKTKSFDPNHLAPLMTDPDLVDQGTGYDLDDSVADIGLYGGQYTWLQAETLVVDFYVSQQHGNDNNDGLSPESPVKTIAKAFSVFYRSTNPGEQRIFIGPGIYRENLKIDLFSGISNDRKVIIYGDPDCHYLTNDHPGIVRITGCEEDELTSASAPVVDLFGASFIEIRNVYIDTTTTAYPAITGYTNNILKNVRVTSYHGIKDMECHNCQVITANIGYENCTCIQCIATGGQTGFKNCDTYNCLALGTTNGYDSSTAYNCLAIGCGGCGFLNTEDHNCYALCCYTPSDPESIELKISCSGVSNNASLSLLNTNYNFLLAPSLINAGTEKIPLLEEDITGATRKAEFVDIGPWEIPKYSYDWENYLGTAPSIRIDGAGDIVFKVPAEGGKQVAKNVSVRSFFDGAGLANKFYIKENLQDGTLQNLEYSIDGLSLIVNSLPGIRTIEYDLPDLISVMSSNISWKEKTNGGLYFDGVDDYVSIPYNAITRPERLTVMAWVEKDDWTENNPVDKNGHIISCGQSGGYGLVVMPDGTVSFQPYINGGYRVATTSSPPTKGTHFICGTYDGQYIRLYIDGELAAETTYSGSISYAYNNALMIGANPDSTTGTDAGYFFEGSVSHVSIWNRALTAGEIAHYYDNDLEGNESGLVAYYKIDAYSGSIVQDLVGGNNGTIYGAIWENFPPIEKVETNFSRDGANWEGWKECQNGALIPDVSATLDNPIKGGKLKVRQTFSPVENISPVLESATLSIDGLDKNYSNPQLILRSTGDQVVSIAKNSHEGWKTISAAITPDKTGVIELILRSTEPREGYYCLFSSLR